MKQTIKDKFYALAFCRQEFVEMVLGNDVMLVGSPGAVGVGEFAARGLS